MDARRSLGVDKGNGNVCQEPQCDEALLSVRKAIILEREGRTLNTLGASTKSKPWTFRFERRFFSSQENRIDIVYIHCVDASTCAPSL